MQCINCFTVNQSIQKSATANIEIVIPVQFGIWHYYFGSVLQILTNKGAQICIGRKAVVTFLWIPWSTSFLQGTLNISRLLIHAVFTSIRLWLYVYESRPNWSLQQDQLTEIKMWEGFL